MRSLERCTQACEKSSGYRSRARLAKANAAAAREADRLARTYVVLGSDGVVVTVAHRHRRVWRS
ncbi:MAG: hypothetical protein ACT4P4_03930 [Betaproteobacteria bacterium]